MANAPIWLAYSHKSYFSELPQDWVVPEKIHTPSTDGIVEILAEGGQQDFRIAPYIYYAYSSLFN